MSATKTIYLKEMREMLRDKRVRSSAFIGPMVMVAMLMALFGILITAISEPRNQRIHVVGSSTTFLQAFRAVRADLHYVGTDAEAREMVRDGDARVVVEFPPDFDEKARQNQPTSVKVLYNPNEQVSQIALGVVERIFSAQNELSRRMFLASQKISPDRADPIHVQTEQVRTGQGKSNDLLVGFLPYMIVIWAFYGGMSIVSDLVAGEKERNTLETLLIAPVGRTQIAMGKFYALATICFLSATSALLGVYLISGLHLPMTKKLFEQGVGVTPQAALVILVVLAPTVALFASMMLAISTYARNVRESQSYLTLVSFVVLMPAIGSQFIGFTDAGSARWVSFVPILSAANIIRQAMFGKFDIPSILSCVTISLVLALIAMRIAVRLFNREQVLTRV